MAETEPQAAPKKKSFMSMLIEWLLVTLIAAGAGFGLTAMQPPPPPDKEEKLSSKMPDSVEKTSACLPGPSVVEMPPIVTNIASPPDTWVRLEASIVVDPKALPKADVVAAEIAADELAYLRTLSVNELQGPIGLENIRQDLRDRAAVRSQGKVVDLLLKTLVLQ